ncbi:MAG: Flp family type IVb pilin [Candidatus Binatales bacterium]|jgi:Flp pilus assembly pilin Flp
MNWIVKTYVKLSERKAQSMTEYALIMAAIAVVVYTSYKTLGNAITNTVGNVTNAL